MARLGLELDVFAVKLDVTTTIATRLCRTLSLSMKGRVSVGIEVCSPIFLPPNS